jgi:TolB protein
MIMGRRLAATVVLSCIAGLLASASAGAYETWGGHKIAFISVRSGSDSDLFVMNDDGTHQRNLTPGTAGAEDSPSVSPDGRRIAFTAYNGKDLEIYLISSDGGKVRNLTKNSSFDFDAAWSPNGKRIAYRCGADASSDQQICVMKLRTRKVRHVTHGANHIGDISWAPDGKTLAFTNLASGASFSDIFTIRPDGTHEHRLTKTGDVPEYSVSWSPNGKRIATESFAGIETISATTGEQVGIAFEGGAPSWSPDGKYLDFYRYDGNDGEIWRARPDGSHAKNLTDNQAQDYFVD